MNEAALPLREHVRQDRAREQHGSFEVYAKQTDGFGFGKEMEWTGDFVAGVVDEDPRSAESRTRLIEERESAFRKREIGPDAADGGSTLA
jgi:hypothetical protein